MDWFSRWGWLGFESATAKAITTKRYMLAKGIGVPNTHSVGPDEQHP